MSESIKESVSEAVSNVVETASGYFHKVTEAATAHFNKDDLLAQFKSFSKDDVIQYVQNLSGDQILGDVKDLKVTPVTVSLGVAALTSALVLSSYFGIGKGKKAKKSKKKLTKAQRANRDIQNVLEYVDTTYVPAIDNYIESYDELKPEDQTYRYNYISEMLLKETLKLDEIDAGTNDVLRTNRKKVIKYIQDHQKRLDAFKKERATAEVL